MDTRQNALLLFARLIVGFIFINAGWMKVSAMAMTLGYFEAMGIGTVLTYIVSYGELVGGVLLVLGLWNTATTTILGVIMLGAIYFTRTEGMQTFGLPLITFASLITLYVSGFGKFVLKLKK